MAWIVVDKVLELLPGISAKSTKKFTKEEPFFENHLPGYPIVPGVLQVEMIAQTGGHCIRALKPNVMTVISRIVDAKFYYSIKPDDQTIITIEVVALKKSYSIIKGYIFLNEKRISEAEIRFGHISKSKLEKER